MEATSNEAEIAKRLGITVEQVREVIAHEAASQGTLTTTVRRIVTDADGKRHWA